VLGLAEVFFTPLGSVDLFVFRAGVRFGYVIVLLLRSSHSIDPCDSHFDHGIA
jgi:hypothetical protein